MRFRLSDDQKALQEGIRSFCEGRVPVEELPALEGHGGFDRALWRELAEMDVFDLRLGEDAGGVGLGMADAAVVFAELGRRLVPGPVLWSHLAAGLVDGAASGEVVVGGLDQIGASPEPVLIEHWPSLDVLLVLRETGVHCIDAPGELEASPIEPPLDPLTPIHHVRSLPEGRRIGDAGAAARLWTEGTVLASALLFGIAEASQELATAYAKQREQFGRPIGGFQAVKHLCADMYVRQEVARAAVYAAAATLDDPEAGDPVRAASSAKCTAGEAAMKNARACIQVHGGMGYTWEVPAHYYLKRTWVLENVFGTVDLHADRLSERVEQAL